MSDTGLSSAAERYQQAWQGDAAPDLEAFLANRGPLTATELAAVLRIDQRERSTRGQRVASEDYLRRFPALATELAALLEDNPGSTSANRTAGPADTLATTSAPGQSSGTRELAGAFGRYNILRLLGRGGMGEVYLAYDTLLHREVAIKVPRTSGELDADMVERFYREARTAAKLQHPHLCAVYDVGEINGLLFLAMPFIQGESLAEVLRRSPLPPQRVAELVGKLALAIEDAHRAGILHRDLKPGNVMLNERGEPVVMDFGLARLNAQQHDLRLTTTGTMLGTPAYASPEQLMGDATLTPASDVYSLGVILFEMLTGRTPFAGSLASVMKQVLLDPPPRPSSLAPGVDPTLETICLRSLAKRPADRFASMAALAEALREVVHFAVIDAVVAPSAGPPPIAPAPSSIAPPPVKLAEVKPVASSTGRIAFRGCLAVLLCGVLACGGLCTAGWYYIPEIAKTIETDFTPDPNWDDLAKFWQVPAAMPPDFEHLSLPGYHFKQQDEVDTIPGFEIKLPASHAVFSNTEGNLDLYVAKATELEKEAVFRKVLEIIQQHDKDDIKDDFHNGGLSTSFLPEYPYYPDRSRLGSATGRFIRYRHRRDYRKPGDAAVFWWDDGWLFFARSSTEADPRFFLRDVLAATNAGAK